METRPLSELKKELSALTPRQILEVCLRVVKYKKENKELVSYLLFEAHDEEHYIEDIKSETETLFREMNKSNLYLAKKSVRKILRMINKFSRYSGKKETEASLRIYFCNRMKASGIAFQKNKVLNNLFQNQVKKVEVCLTHMHEDMQFDFRRELEELQ
jgi:hypothetical protein